MWLTSSSMPTSTTRWPAPGSRPVVSVSRTISRMARLLPARRAEYAVDDAADLFKGILETAAGVDDEIGPPALLRIGNLAGHDGGKFGGCHPRTFEGPGLLQRLGRRDHHHLVDLGLAAGFVEQRVIKDRQPVPAGSCLLEESLFLLAHQRVHDGL